MKIKLQGGDTIAIPEGCKAIVKEGNIEIVKVSEFKDGDVLCSIYDDTILIFKETNKDNKDYFDSYYNSKYQSNQTWNKDWIKNAFRYATESEKSQLFCQMREKGWLWNAEKKCLEFNFWKAKYGEKYYFLDISFSVSCSTATSKNKGFDDMHYNSFCQFRTEKYAKEAAKRIKETLQKYHEEIGE